MQMKKKYLSVNHFVLNYVDSAATNPVELQLPSDLDIHLPHVPSDHLRPQVTLQSTTHLLQLVAGERQNRPPEEGAKRTRLREDEVLVGEYEMVGRRPSKQHRRRAQHRHLRHRTVSLYPRPEPPVVCVGA